METVWVVYKQPDLGSTVEDYGALWVDRNLPVPLVALPAVLDWITRSGYLLLEVKADR